MGAADAVHVMGRFGMGRTAAYRLLRVPCDAGLVERVRLVNGAPSLFLASSEARRWTDTVELGACRLTPGAVTHWRWCGWAALALEAEFGPERVLSDREVRVWERAAGRPVASALVGELPDGRPRAHRPDFAVVASDGDSFALAVEVELTVKKRRRLESICCGYARNRALEAVRYYAPPRVHRAVSRAARAASATDVIETRPLAELEQVPMRW